MKGYKKKITGLLLMGMLCCAPVSAYATGSTPLTVSSGLNIYTKEAESTFDAHRTIYGEAEPGTSITVSVSRKNTKGVMQTVSSQNVKVGSMGIFSVTTDLGLGYNYIHLSAKKQGHNEVSHTVTVKRLSQQIKKDLQKMIALPGNV